MVERPAHAIPMPTRRAFERDQAATPYRRHMVRMAAISRTRRRSTARFNSDLDRWGTSEGGTELTWTTWIEDRVRRRLAEVTVAGRGRCVATLEGMWRLYEAGLADRASATILKRTSAWRRLSRHFGEKRPLDEVTPSIVQGYIDSETARVRVQVLHDVGLLKQARSSSRNRPYEPQGSRA